MPEEDRKRVLFIMGLFANTLISFSGFVEVCTQFLLQRHGRKRRRDEYEADGEDENFALAIATMTFEEWPRLWTRVKSIHFVTCVLNGTLMADDEGNGEEFKKQFRLSRASFEVLHNLLQPDIHKEDTRWRPAVDTRVRVLAYLLFLFHGETYFNVGHRLGISQTSAFQAIHDCVYSICRHMYSTHIRLPTNEEARGNMQRWKEKTKIPGIYGAIDTTHITIRKPSERGDDYIIGRFLYGVKVQGCRPRDKLLCYMLAYCNNQKQYLRLDAGTEWSPTPIVVFDVDAG